MRQSDHVSIVWPLLLPRCCQLYVTYLKSGYVVRKALFFWRDAADSTGNLGPVRGLSVRY